jgi:hypothetical protein
MTLHDVGIYEQVHTDLALCVSAGEDSGSGLSTQTAECDQYFVVSTFPASKFLKWATAAACRSFHHLQSVCHSTLSQQLRQRRQVSMSSVSCCRSTGDRWPECCWWRTLQVCALKARRAVK